MPWRWPKGGSDGHESVEKSMTLVVLKLFLPLLKSHMWGPSLGPRLESAFSFKRGIAGLARQGFLGWSGGVGGAFGSWRVGGRGDLEAWKTGLHPNEAPDLGLVLYPTFFGNVRGCIQFARGRAVFVPGKSCGRFLFSNAQHAINGLGNRLLLFMSRTCAAAHTPAEAQALRSAIRSRLAKMSC